MPLKVGSAFASEVPLRLMMSFRCRCPVKGAQTGDSGDSGDPADQCDQGDQGVPLTKRVCPVTHDDASEQK